MPIIKPRAYQRRATKKTIEAVANGKHPLAVLPTGSGKTIVVCTITAKYLNDNIEKDVLILSHRSKILEQDHRALSNYFPDFEIGLYSAGLGSKTHTKITVAGIQSVWRKPEDFENVGLVIIDEAHLINHNASGMYRKFLMGIDAQYVGLTATHFRLGHGYIHKGENRLFNHLAYDLSSTENYNKLVNSGYLSPMFPRSTKLRVSTDKIKMRAGDFAADSSKDAFDREGITDVACNEILRIANEEKLSKWLVFAIDIEHAEHINRKFIELGVSSAVVHSKMEESKDAILKLYEKGVYRVLVNVELLTTGLDIPSIDLIGILRPTQSPALHVQMLGRGGRPCYAEGYDLTKKKERLKAIRKGPKPFCIVLDFAGNTQRLGPINNVIVLEKGDKKGDGNGEAITKVCPKCDTINHASVKICECCGHKFKFKQKISVASGTDEIISSGKESAGNWFNVNEIVYSIHQTPGKPSSLKVIYKCGMRTFTEYICVDHGGYARHKANHWIRARIKHGERKPKNLSELYKLRGELRAPTKIKAEQNGKWFNITSWTF